VGTLSPRTTVVYRGKRQAVRDLAGRLQLKWRAQLGVRAAALRVYAPALGQVRLVVLRNEHGNCEYLVTNALATDLSTLVARKRSRWRIETIFRDTKQLAGLGACQCWVDQALVRHVALVLLTFVVLQLLRRDPQETVGAVKTRWQAEVLRDGQAPPQPLRAAPLEFRRKRTA
jgi:SRSO17 transposase